MVHKRVKQYIQRTEVKQGWLANRLGISEGALSLILSGKRKLTADELERLCAILCVSVDTFVKPEEHNLRS